MTRVIHIRNAPAGWQDDPQFVYIGRPSKWGNPFTVELHGREEAIARYRAYLLEDRPDLIEDARRELRERTLVCFCAPWDCHGYVLAEFAEEVRDDHEGIGSSAALVQRADEDGAGQGVHDGGPGRRQGPGSDGHRNAPE